MINLYKNNVVENVKTLKLNPGEMKCDDTAMKRKRQETGGELPGIRTSPPYYSDHSHQTMTSTSPELPNPKKEIISRKCTARKNLMENIYTRQSPVKRSNTFLAGEKIFHDGYFPHLSSSFDEAAKIERNSKAKIIRTRESSLRRTRSEKSRKSTEHSEATTDKRRPIKKISLPEILMDINISAKQQDRQYQKHEDGGDILEYLDKEFEKEKLKSAKYRPLTPGLLQELNRLRLTSKQKAAQWVKSIPTDRKYFYGDNYLLSHPDLNDHPGWIYSAD